MTRNILLLVLFISGCEWDAESDLEGIAKDKINCQDFKKRYDEVGVTAPTENINNRIKICKSLGAWNEKAPQPTSQQSPAQIK